MTSRTRFGSRPATILTMIGVAVGLGNVWRFPYMMGSYGGSAFLFVYIAFVVLFGIPALMSEWALGRETRQDTLGSLGIAFGRCGRAVGWVMVTAVCGANSYYLVIIGNVVYSLLFSVGMGFREETIASYRAGLANPWLQGTITLSLLASAIVVLGMGFNRGIERLSRWFVPLAGAVLVYLIVASLALPGAPAALARFLLPDFSRLTPTHVFAAMGQAFYSLSLGGTMLVIYGSYLRPEENLRLSAFATAFGDLGAALLAASFLVPTTIVFGLELQAGPRLIFQTLPLLFAEIPGGRLVGSLFLLALSLVAYLSSLAALQVLVGALNGTVGLSMRVTLTVIAIAQVSLVLPSVIRPQIIATLDLWLGSGMQLLGSGVALVAIGWGLGRGILLRQVFGSDEASGFWPASLAFWVRWIVPVALATMLALYLEHSFFG